MPSWPGGLPQQLEMDEFQETLPAASVESQMDVGPPKKRRRFTAAPTPITGRQLLTKAQVATLDTFYRSTVSFGSLSFDWTHPRTGAAATLRFKGEPVIQMVGPDSFYARYQFLILP